MLNIVQVLQSWRRLSTLLATHASAAAKRCLVPLQSQSSELRNSAIPGSTCVQKHRHFLPTSHGIPWCPAVYRSPLRLSCYRLHALDIPKSPPFRCRRWPQRLQKTLRSSRSHAALQPWMGNKHGKVEHTKALLIFPQLAGIQVIKWFFWGLWHWLLTHETILNEHA